MSRDSTLSGIAESPACEAMEMSDASSDVILRYTREHLCYFGAVSPVPSNLVQLPVRFHCDRTIGDSEFDYQALFDCGVTSSNPSLLISWASNPPGISSLSRTVTDLLNSLWVILLSLYPSVVILKTLFVHRSSILTLST